MAWRLIAASTLVPAPWRNGLGTSRDIVTTRGADGGLLWQMGVADLVRDAPFSDFPECDRLFTPIEGGEPALAFRGGAFEPCPLLVPKAFPGDVPTLSRIVAPGRAFNLVWDRRRHRGAVAVLRLEAGEAIHVPDAAAVAIHCVTGRIAAVGELLGAGDTILGRGPADPAAAAEDTVAIVASVSAAG